MPDVKETDWQVVASQHARRALEHDMDVRFGTRYVADRVFCFFNNNSFRDKPSRGDEQRQAFRRLLEAEGLAELAYAEYPEQGKDEGYSYAMILKDSNPFASVPATRQKLIMQLWRDVFAKVGWDEEP
jgi:hypothetical protein